MHMYIYMHAYINVCSERSGTPNIKICTRFVIIEQWNKAKFNTVTIPCPPPSKDINKQQHRMDFCGFISCCSCTNVHKTFLIVYSQVAVNSR